MMVQHGGEEVGKLEAWRRAVKFMLYEGSQRAHSLVIESMGSDGFRSLPHFSLSRKEEEAYSPYRGLSGVTEALLPESKCAISGNYSVL